MDQGFKSYAAEFLGVFTLCLAGQGAMLAHALTGAPGSGLLGIALAHGLALTAMTTAFAAVSGGHLNPAVTLGFLVTGRQSLGSAAAYGGAQLLGAVAASLLLRAVHPSSIGQAIHLGAPALHPGVGAASGALLECVLTFLLVTVFWGTLVDPRAPRLGGLGVGLLAIAGTLVGGPLTGAAMNPARTLGPMLVSGSFDHAGVYLVAQLAGGAAAALACRRLMLPER